MINGFAINAAEVNGERRVWIDAAPASLALTQTGDIYRGAYCEGNHSLVVVVGGDIYRGAYCVGNQTLAIAAAGEAFRHVKVSGGPVSTLSLASTGQMFIHMCLQGSAITALTTSGEALRGAYCEGGSQTVLSAAPMVLNINMRMAGASTAQLTAAASAFTARAVPLSPKRRLFIGLHTRLELLRRRYVRLEGGSTMGMLSAAERYGKPALATDSPAKQVLRVPARLRRLLIGKDSRAFALQASARDFSVPGSSDRTFMVPQEEI